MKTPLEIGVVIGQKYKIEKVLGEGGFGIAYLCKDMILDVCVVLKECFPEESEANLLRQGEEICAMSQGDLEAFAYFKESALKEGRRMSSIRHSNIVYVRNTITTNGTVYIVMDYIKGRSLKELIDMRECSAALVLDILRSLLEALDYLHAKGVYHKDLKPDNIIIREDNSPVIIDFGAARNASELKSNKTLIFSGSYSAPELKYEDMEVDGRCDIYSLGVIMYEFIAGKMPSLNIKNKNELVQLENANNYDNALLISIDKARSYVDSDRHSSAKKWLELLPKKSNKVEAVKTQNNHKDTQEEVDVFAPQAKGDSIKNSRDNNLLAQKAVFLAFIIMLVIGVFLFCIDADLLDGIYYTALGLCGLALLVLHCLGLSISSKILSLCFSQGSYEHCFSLVPNAAPLLAGRDSDVDIKIPDVEKYRGVSRRHFTISYVSGGILIKNLKGSDNIIKINGVNVLDEMQLGVGEDSVLEIGDLTFELRKNF